MTNRTTELAYDYGDECARSDIECMCLMFMEDGTKPQTSEDMQIGWWDIKYSSDPSDQHYITRALEYLEARGMLVRHPNITNWVRLQEPTIARPV